MKTIIVVETERDRETLEASCAAAGVDRIVAAGTELSVTLAQSFAMSPGRRVVYVVEAASEDDRFFVEWMRGKYELVGATPSPLRILPAAPTLSSAVQDAKWRDRLSRVLFPVVVDVGLVNGVVGVKTIDAIKTVKMIGGIPLVDAKHGIERVLEQGKTRFELSPGTDIAGLEFSLRTSGFSVVQ